MDSRPSPCPPPAHFPRHLTSTICPSLASLSTSLICLPSNSRPPSSWSYFSPSPSPPPLSPSFSGSRETDSFSPTASSVHSSSVSIVPQWQPQGRTQESLPTLVSSLLTRTQNVRSQDGTYRPSAAPLPGQRSKPPPQTITHGLVSNIWSHGAAPSDGHSDGLTETSRTPASRDSHPQAELRDHPSGSQVTAVIKDRKRQAIQDFSSQKVPLEVNHVSFPAGYTSHQSTMKHVQSMAAPAGKTCQRTSAPHLLPEMPKTSPEPVQKIRLEDCETGVILQDCVTDTFLHDCRSNAFAAADALASEQLKGIARSDTLSQRLLDFTSSQESSEGHQEPSQGSWVSTTTPPQERNWDSQKRIYQTTQMSRHDCEEVESSSGESCDPQEEWQPPENTIGSPVRPVLQWFVPAKDKSSEDLLPHCQPTSSVTQKQVRPQRSRPFLGEAEAQKDAACHLLKENISLNQAQPASMSRQKEKHSGCQLQDPRTSQALRASLLENYTTHRGVPEDCGDYDKVFCQECYLSAREQQTATKPRQHMSNKTGPSENHHCYGRHSPHHRYRVPHSSHYQTVIVCGHGKVHSHKRRHHPYARCSSSY